MNDAMNNDRLCTLALSQLSHGAEWAKNYIVTIEAGVHNLPCRPEYATQAEAALEDIEDKLSDLLARVRSALSEYEAKPIRVKSIDVDLREDCRMLSLDAAE